jgi:E3 ubiquitin-protein ligase HUWE1
VVHAIHVQVLDVAFTQSIYKHILKRPVRPSDLESIDAQYAKSLMWVESNDITHADLNLTFWYVEKTILY